MIQALAAFDPDAEVLILADTLELRPVELVLLDWASQRRGELQLAYPDEPGQPIVRIVGPEGPGESYFVNATPA